MSWAFVATVLASSAFQGAAIAGIAVASGVGAASSISSAKKARKASGDEIRKREREAAKFKKEEAAVEKQSAMRLLKRRGATGDRAPLRSDVLTSPLGVAGARLAGGPKKLIGR